LTGLPPVVEREPEPMALLRAVVLVFIAIVLARTRCDYRGSVSLHKL